MKRKSDWDAVVAAFEDNGLTQAEFCKRRKVVLGSFRNHLCRVRAERVMAPVFAELAVSQGTFPCVQVELHFPDGTFLCFPEGIDASDLRAYIAVLRP